MKFYVIEGIRGAGKTAVTNRVASMLAGLNGYKVQIGRDPGSTTLGEELRVLLRNTTIKKHRYVEGYLYLAAREQLIQEVLLPLKEKETDLSVHTIHMQDRWTPSTLAYQDKVFNGLAMEVHRGLVPDKIFWIDTPSDVALERARLRDGLAASLLEEEYEWSLYERFWELNAGEVERINGLLSGEAVAQRIFEIIVEDLKK